MIDIIKQIDDKFKSSNSVPVERVPLTLNEWNEIKSHIAELMRMPEFPDVENKMRGICKSVGAGNKC